MLSLGGVKTMRKMERLYGPAATAGSAIAFLVLAAVLASATAAAATPLSGRVVAVADGDTLTVLDAGNQQRRIRLAEIDAPEKRQAFGQRAKQSLSDLCYGKSAVVAVATQDRYGRSVGRVSCGGVDANLEQVRRGLAWAYRQYRPSAPILQAEASARQARVGLWRDASPTPPWEFRHGKLSVNPSIDQASASAPQGAQACGAKRYCKQMVSCEEARFYLQRCGVRSLDGNGDGVPCETLCGP
jgi:endonuclease YncB( thermonuclease family)